MNAHIKHQIIGPEDDPQYVVVPYSEYLKMAGTDAFEATIPHEVVELHVIKGLSLLRAWRTHKDMSQDDVAKKAGITQAAYSQMEKPGIKPHEATLEKIARALGITKDHLMLD
ncbi:MAG: helix-turn-helix domain-containing protein [Xanthomonadales bacterium]|nr:helix-turn-helix domain-containing protein [Xanthomonadales bacterium]